MYALKIIWNHLKFRKEENNYKKLWRRENSNNNTYPLCRMNLDNIKIGNYTYGGINVINSETDGAKVEIGHFCSIGPGVTFEPAGEHYLKHISTFPFKAECIKEVKTEDFSKGGIVIEDDVWIGANVLILSGVTIHQGAVIAAGAVVAKDVPPYAIVGGVPAKLIRFRFNQDIVDELMKIDYSMLDLNMIKSHKTELYIDLENKNMIDWLPKK